MNLTKRPEIPILDGTRHRGSVIIFQLLITDIEAPMLFVGETKL